MIILPAIDIKDGNCVRLVKGDYATAHKVAEDPVETAIGFKNTGAKWLHMVDLDGAKEGKLVNKDIITAVCSACGMQVEVGGGIRDMKSITYYLEHDISRVILGSSAIKNPEFVKEAIREYDDKIIVGIDARNGMAAAEGWLQSSEINYIELAKRMESIGVKHIIFTDIACDGTLSGPNLPQLDKLNASVSCDIIASGGVATIKDILNLRDLNVYGAICGKALYTGSLKLEQALSIARSVAP